MHTINPKMSPIPSEKERTAIVQLNADRNTRQQTPLSLKPDSSFSSFSSSSSDDVNNNRPKPPLSLKRAVANIKLPEVGRLSSRLPFTVEAPTDEESSSLLPPLRLNDAIPTALPNILKLETAKKEFKRALAGASGSIPFTTENDSDGEVDLPPPSRQERFGVTLPVVPKKNKEKPLDNRHSFFENDPYVNFITREDEKRCCTII